MGGCNLVNPSGLVTETHHLKKTLTRGLSLYDLLQGVVLKDRPYPQVGRTGAHRFGWGGVLKDTLKILVKFLTNAPIRPQRSKARLVR